MVNKNRSLFPVSILLPPKKQLFWIVISCKIVRGSRKFKFFRKLAVIHEKFLVLLKLRPAPEKTGRGLCIPALDYLSTE